MNALGEINSKHRRQNLLLYNKRRSSFTCTLLFECYHISRISRLREEMQTKESTFVPTAEKCYNECYNDIVMYSFYTTVKSIIDCFHSNFYRKSVIHCTSFCSTKYGTRNTLSVPSNLQLRCVL